MTAVIRGGRTGGVEEFCCSKHTIDTRQTTKTATKCPTKQQEQRPQQQAHVARRKDNGKARATNTDTNTNTDLFENDTSTA